MKKKVVYQDGDYTKVERGAVEITDDFIVVINLNGNETIIGKRAIISITEERD